MAAKGISTTDTLLTFIQPLLRRVLVAALDDMERGTWSPKDAPRDRLKGKPRGDGER
jgi:hypothetical protein